MTYLNREENEKLIKAKNKIRALAHPLRQSMLQTIQKNGNKMKVTDIYTKLRIEQSVASQHLGILRNESFVNAQRDGKKIWYSVNSNAIQECITTCNLI